MKSLTLILYLTSFSHIFCYLVENGRSMGDFSLFNSSYGQLDLLEYNMKPKETESLEDDYGDGTSRSTPISNVGATEIISAGSPVEVMDIDAIQNMISDFTNFTTNGRFNTSEIVERITQMELNIQDSTNKLRQEIEQDAQKLHQLNYALSSITNVKTKVAELEGHMSSLTNVIDNIRTGNFAVPTVNTSYTVPHTAWATLYQFRGHMGQTVELDFRSCSISDDCCQNLGDLNDATESIHTHDTCVVMFKDIDCTGEERQIYPGSPTNHYDFGSFRNVFSSGKPCAKRAL